jgi:hypothetical protein
MKIITPKLHGIIDYVSVIGLALAPTLFGLQGIAATLAYALSGIHLLMTVLTAFPAGLVKVVPLKLHGMVEILVGVSLAALPWALASTIDLGANGRMFYSVFGLVLIAVWFTTDYGATAEEEKARSMASGSR